MFQTRMEFVGKFITGSTRTAACWITTLYHKIGNDAVENDSVIEAFACQKNKIVDCLGCLICKKLNDHCLFVRLHAGFVFLLGIDLHLWWIRSLLSHSYFSS